MLHYLSYWFKESHWHSVLWLLLLTPLMSMAAQARPAAWARPIVDKHLENFYQVSPWLYRAAQPYKPGFQALPVHGIGEVLDLRLYHRDVPAVDAPLNLHQAPLFASLLNQQQVIKALNVIANARKPILVHCLHGSDRTGLVVAMYRVVCQNWSKQQALDELQHGNFGFHSVFSNIPAFIENADIQQWRQWVQGPACRP